MCTASWSTASSTVWLKKYIISVSEWRDKETRGEGHTQGAEAVETNMKDMRWVWFKVKDEETENYWEAPHKSDVILIRQIKQVKSTSARCVILLHSKHWSTMMLIWRYLSSSRSWWGKKGLKRCIQINPVEFSSTTTFHFRSLVIVQRDFCWRSLWERNAEKNTTQKHSSQFESCFWLLITNNKLI